MRAATHRSAKCKRLATRMRKTHTANTRARCGSSAPEPSLIAPLGAVYLSSRMRGNQSAAELSNQ